MLLMDDSRINSSKMPSTSQGSRCRCFSHGRDVPFYFIFLFVHFSSINLIIDFKWENRVSYFQKKYRQCSYWEADDILPLPIQGFHKNNSETMSTCAIMSFNFGICSKPISPKSFGIGPIGASTLTLE